jgi:hypothetical protein
MIVWPANTSILENTTTHSPVLSEDNTVVIIFTLLAVGFIFCIMIIPFYELCCMYCRKEER